MTRGRPSPPSSSPIRRPTSPGGLPAADRSATPWCGPLTLDAAARDGLRRLRRVRRRAPVRSLGLEPGQLPRGYATLPGVSSTRPESAATAIREMQAPSGPRRQSTDRPRSVAEQRSQSGRRRRRPARRTPTTHHRGSWPRAPWSASEVGAAPAPEGRRTAHPDPRPGARSRFFIPGLAALCVVATPGRARDHQAPPPRRCPARPRHRIGRPVMSTAMARSLVVSRMSACSSRSRP